MEDHRMQKLRELHMKRNEARNRNFEDVKEEDRRNKETPKDIAAAQKRRREAEQLLAIEEAKKRGDDYERLQNLNYSVEECDAWDEVQTRRKSKEDQGFSDYRQATIRKYEQLTDSIKVDQQKYQKQDKKELDVYTLSHTQDDMGRVNALVRDLKAQEQKRRGYSRRRQFKEGDVDYINERNRQFNLKIARAFDMYTSDIKDNLERGTAL
jgi:pre-mRNA-splicing factor SYF2